MNYRIKDALSYSHEGEERVRVVLECDRSFADALINGSLGAVRPMVPPWEEAEEEPEQLDVEAWTVEQMREGA